MSYRDKMQKYEILIKNPEIKKHLPDTRWYSLDNLQDMIGKYSVVYIKPNNGKQGNNIIRVRKISEKNCEISYDRNTMNVERINLHREMKNILLSKFNYIIQQGIDLATLNGYSFDIRIVTQRPDMSWQVTLTGVKVAQIKDAVTTNISKGGKLYSLKKILQEYDQRSDWRQEIKKIKALCIEISDMLSIYIPLRVYGLDIAIDKNNRIWFLEANTQPECNPLKAVCSTKTVEKYNQAKKIISGYNKNTL